MSPLAADADGVTRTFVGFARVLRGAGVAATPDRLQGTAVGHLDVPAGRRVLPPLTLCTGPDDPTATTAHCVLRRADRPAAAHGAAGPGARPVASLHRAAGGEGPTRGAAAATASEAEVRHRDLAGLAGGA